MVASVFGGEPAGKRPGIARNCDYPLTGGREVSIFTTARPPSGMGCGRATPTTGGRSNRWPASARRRSTLEMSAGSIVVRAGEVIFAVAVVSGSSDTETPDKIEQLAKRIAQDL